MYCYLKNIFSGPGPIAVAAMSLSNSSRIFIIALVVSLFVNTKNNTGTKLPFYLRILFSIKSENTLLTVIKVIGIIYSAVTAFLMFYLFLGALAWNITYY